MAREAGAYYLDPVLPLVVRQDRAAIPTESTGGSAVQIVVLWDGSCRRRLPKRASSVVDTPPVVVWGPPASFQHLDLQAGWHLTVGVSLIEGVAQTCHGDPGACRFLDELAGPGAAPIDVACRATIDANLRRLAGELSERQVAFRARARGIVAEVLLDLYRGSIASDQATAGAGYRLGRVVSYIEEHHADELTLERLAALIGCSPAYLSRLFHAEIGQPPFVYINRVRIRHACTMLRRSDSSVTEIAYDVGYNNVSFFNRYFRKVMDCSPREYRRRIRSG